MDGDKAQEREMQILRNRLSRLSEAGLRINESLDFDAVLQGVLDSARSLTGASYGALVLLDGSGGIQDFLSSGLTAEQAQRMWALPDGMRFFEYLSSIEEPLRLPDLLSHIRSQGLPDLRPPVEVGASLSFLAAPVLHIGKRVGNIYVAEKETSGEFSREDEETLVMFASQAALVIANARRHREEQRTRADLETLVDTAPVGVVVFDAASGTVKSLNREARRIVGGLLSPDGSVERILSTLTLRRADGRTVSLEEFTLAEALSGGETVRAEEIAIELPDGRSVSILVNATPIRSGDGKVASFVVTMQDLTSLEELERLRAEFLGMVSHELRLPLASIKGSAATALGSTPEPDPAVTRQFFRIIEERADHMHGLVSDLLDVARIETGTLPVDLEPAEVASLVDRARNDFRNAGGRNDLEIDVPPDLPLALDDRRRIVQVIVNLLSNAARHSPESSVIQVSAVDKGVHVEICVADRGRGIPAEDLPHLFRKFSRREDGAPAGGMDGSGLGLAICKGIVEAHGGRIRAESDGPGLGARFTFTLPAVREAQPTRNSRNRRESRSPGGTVLVVDDDPQTLRLVRDTLSAAGFRPVATADPEEAPLLMAEYSPRLVLLDLVLPECDGVELMGDLLAVSPVPVVFLSVYGRDEVIARALEEGPPTTSSSPSRPRSWWPGCGRPCGGSRNPGIQSLRESSCWATWPLTTRGGG